VTIAALPPSGSETPYAGLLSWTSRLDKIGLMGAVLLRDKTASRGQWSNQYVVSLAMAWLA
jgi:hypothetical protein